MHTGSMLAAGCLLTLALAPGQAQSPTVAAGPEAPPILVTRNRAQPSRMGAAETFTGSVRIVTLIPARDPSRTVASSVTFEPGARTAWHMHPVGQNLVVISGRGLVQRWGGPVEEIRPGDVVWIPPGVKHWHGATPTTAMTHIAIQEQVDGKTATWMEKVSEEQYRAEIKNP